MSVCSPLSRSFQGGRFADKRIGEEVKVGVVEMDGLVVRLAQAPVRTIFGSEGGGNTGGGVSTGVAALFLAAAGRDGAVRHARKGAQGLCRSLFPGVLGHEKQGSASQSREHGATRQAEDAGSHEGDLAGMGSHKPVSATLIGGGRSSADPTLEAPILLKMRDHAPPSFWEPESPAPLANPDRKKAKQDEAMWQGEFGRVAGKDWASSERVDNVRSMGRRMGSESPPRLLGKGLELQPSGPRGPDSPFNRGKPEWYKMLQQHSNSDEDDERSSDEMHSEDGDDTFDDEMQKVSDKDVKESAKRSRERAAGARAAMANRSLTYGEYLHLDKILGSQQPQSAMFDTEVHEEMLFIVIHQAYELWFKQILHELDAIKSTFESALSEGWGPMDMGMCVERANRMAVVMRVLVHQMDVLETMQPQQFQDFRDFLNPASGFQSVQFRKIENKLGLRQEQRIQHSGCPYYEHLEKQEEQAEVLESEKGRSLAQLLGEWLGGLMNDTCPGFDFAAYMRNSIELAAEHDRDAISKYPQSHLSKHPGAGPSGREGLLAELEKKKSAHLRLFDRAAHDELVRKGIRHFGFEATMACVFVQSFSNELAFQAPHRLITHLIEIDELLAQWRHRHSLVVMRMIGSKNGTGGSSGHAYLNAVLAKSRIFTDLCHASHYLLPRHSMPPLPPMVRARLTTGFKPEATLIPRGARAKSFS